MSTKINSLRGRSAAMMARGKTARVIARIAGCVAMVIAGAAGASAPNTTAFTYQGQLKEAGAVVNGTYDFEFRLSDSAVLGIQLAAAQTAADVVVVDGVFTVNLDFGNQWNGDARWLDIRVRPGVEVGAYTVLSPRQKLNAAPYAHGLVLPVNETANASTGLMTLTNTNTTGHGMRVTSVAPSGEYPAGFFQPVIAADTNDGNGIYALTSSNGAYALYAVQGGDSGRAIVGINRGTSGNVATLDITSSANNNTALAVTSAGTGTVGGFAASNSASTSTALQATQAGTGGAGFFDNNNTNATVPTLRAESSAQGESIPGANQNKGIAIKGSSTGSFGIGVMGTGLTAGVFGYSGATGGAGVLGRTNGGGGSVSSGVRGEGNGAGTVAISAFNNFGTGVYSLAQAGGTGISASNGGSNVSGYAGDFDGRVRIDGNLAVLGSVSKFSGTFKIDHPLYPEAKYLYHSFVESPEMKNIYDGVATVGADGSVIITMPEYFEALNMDFRYQLTCMGSHAPVYVSKEIEKNHFEIAGGKAGMKVSWQVTGVRQDAYAKTNRVQVEVEKAAADQGKYLYPAGFGAGIEKQIGGAKPKM